VPEKVSIDVIPGIRDAVFDLVSSYPKSKRFCRYADVRIEVSEGKVAVAENGMDKFSTEDYGFSFGVRVLAGQHVAAPGYVGEIVGTADLPRLQQRLREALDSAYARAVANARGKDAARSRTSTWTTPWPTCATSRRAYATWTPRSLTTTSRRSRSFSATFS